MAINGMYGRAGVVLCAGMLAVATPAFGDSITMQPRVIPVGKWAEGIAFDGSSLWVAESGQRTIAQVSPAQGVVARRISVGRLPVNMEFANDGAIYALVQTDKLIWQQFPGSQQGRQIGGLQGCPQAMTAARQYLWVLTWPDCSSDAGRVIRVDPRTNERQLSQGLGEMAVAVTSYQGRIFVAHSRGQALSVIDEQSLAIQKANIQGVSAQTLAANGTQLHVGGTIGEGGKQGVVVSVNPATLQEVRRQLVDQPIVSISNDDQHVVAIGSGGRIYVFSAASLDLVRTIDITGASFNNVAGGGGPKALMIRNETLYVSNGQQFGENGAILVLAGWRPAAMPVQPPVNPSAMPVSPTQPTAGATDCPYEVAAAGDSTGIWMYEDPDSSATKVEPIPSDSKGLVADRCLTTWCHVTFRGKTGWVQRKSIKAVCN